MDGAYVEDEFMCGARDGFVTVWTWAKAYGLFLHFQGIIV